MKKVCGLFFFLFFSIQSYAQTSTIHVYVALCDNINQGIVPVPASLGNGQDPKSNLYWGAAYGVKSYFKFKTKDWELVETLKSDDKNVLERLLFKHRTKDAYMLADAYDGAKIQDCIEDFLKASNGQREQRIAQGDLELSFGGAADLVSYIGHDGLMEFSVDIAYKEDVSKPKDAILLACYSKEFFKEELKKAKASPLLWTTHLMAPEAYTLKAALDGWLLRETPAEIEERAAQAYNKYQKCGIRGARNLFASGY